MERASKMAMAAVIGLGGLALIASPAWADASNKPAGGVVRLAQAAPPAAPQGAMPPGMMGQGMMGQGQGMMGQGMTGGMMGSAGCGGPGMSMRAAAIDRNHDGLVDADEAAAHIEAIFSFWDADEDDTLTPDEYVTAGMMAPAGQMAPRYQAMMDRRKTRFSEMDKDKDGKVSLDEFLAAGKARYAAADRDKDGKVTVWEFRSARHI